MTAIKLADMVGGIQGRVPVAVSADGNCLFNAISVLLIGNESIAQELRFRCTVELVKNLVVQRKA